MKTTVKLIFILCSLFLLNACSSGSKYINPDYKDRPITGLVLIVPVIDSVIVTQNEDMFTPTDVDMIIKTYISSLNNNFREQILHKSTFKKIDYIDFTKDIEFEKRSFRMDVKELDINVALDPIKYDSTGHTIVLYLDDLTIAFSKERIETSDPKKTYSAVSEYGEENKVIPRTDYELYITFSIEYVFIDNRNNNYISYGLLENKEKFNSAKEVDQLLNEVIISFTKDLLHETPFEKLE